MLLEAANHHPKVDLQDAGVSKCPRVSQSVGDTYGSVLSHCWVMHVPQALVAVSSTCATEVLHNTQLTNAVHLRCPCQVGVGNNPPCRPHHRAASCVASSDPTQPCDCTAFFNPGCNPNTIYGALVGGPNQNDEFTDTRWDYQAAEVALDWNAGFTGMLAGLAESGISWDQCKAAGMENGRGAVNGVGLGIQSGLWWHAALLGLVVLWMMRQH